ncbi:MAG TPA: biotin synthase BioB, partial [Candidatus Acidoferrales bacterium]|nr:biotin synthase BioB [Candidatus Acidoferrales bacterium]
MEIRHDWTRAEIRTIFNSPLPELIFQAQTIHREFHKPEEVQLCRLLSIKTGACPEDCAYCSQSAHYKTGIVRQKLMEPAAVLESAKRAKADGATRFCMGAAWRDVPDGKEFENVLEMVRGVASLDLEVCCTLGMLTETQASALKEAGLTAYNHNLDTSPEFYGHIITTRVYEDRLQTIARVRNAGITVCCGGILGIGESEED